MEYIYGIVQAFVIVAVLWMKISGIEKRFDVLESRVNNFLNGKAVDQGKRK